MIDKWNIRPDGPSRVVPVLPILAEKGFEIVFGRAQWLGLEGFEAHQEVKRQFFDEDHALEKFEYLGEGQVRSVACWSAHYLRPNEAKSKQLKARVHHYWSL